MIFRTDRLKKKRLEKKFTQKYMAQKLGITRQAYGYYETGQRRVDLETATVLAEILEIEPTYLVDLQENTVTGYDKETEEAIQLILDAAKRSGLSPGDPKFREVFLKVIEAVTIANRENHK
ncbi:hypothetical protein A3844_01925 [Paenibacillus helianthi]|uniref:HTH cro/C1-type domain-containing protein n=1 Tax=Paenibacillus helianthi TaxID=1349432 RepID=A0ABX3EX08_9BACL|nr:helix-turn-helix transcriptional regulator [Paenibacillus helianthi]OKP91896.1 hypothetical protein A3844_01925 [Paenibacillus helianthi]